MDLISGFVLIHGEINGEKMVSSELLLGNVELIVNYGLAILTLLHTMNPPHSCSDFLI